MKTSSIRLFCCLAVLEIAGSARAQVPPAVAEKPAYLAVLLGKKVPTANRRHLAVIIFDELTRKYAEEHALQPDKAEVDAFIRRLVKEDERKEQEIRAEKERLEAMLKNKNLSPEEREKGETALNQTKDFLKQIDEMKKKIDEQEESVRQARQTVAEREIRVWKVNKALYDQYGGDVICSRGKAEPVDAYRLFLKEAEENGSFQIMDPDAEERFWFVFTNVSMYAQWRVPEAERRKRIDTPWWLAEPEKKNDGPAAESEKEGGAK